MKRKNLFDEINLKLACLSTLIKQSNRRNLQDINIHAENFFRDLLNLVFDYNLKNINIVDPNAKAIDLGCDKSRIAIQVTADSDISKIKHTYDSFLSKSLQRKYNRLIILIIGDKKRYRQKFIGGSVFKISTSEDIWDLNDLIAKVHDLSMDKLQDCRDFLFREFPFQRSNQSNEVKTLVRLIEVLSIAEDDLSVGDNLEDPDPEGKIRARFAGYAIFLQNTYVELHALYGHILAEVNKYSDLSHIRMRKLQVFLMSWSSRVLSECGGDPQSALSSLTQEVLAQMGASDTGYDDGAVRFFLISQLIACNVFPNKRLLSV